MPSRIPPAIQQLTHWIRQQLLPAAYPRKRTPSASPLILVVAVMSITTLMGQRFYDQPALDVGRVSPSTIVAPESVSVEDSHSTEEKRKAARTGAVPVLRMDTTINQQFLYVQSLTSCVSFLVVHAVCMKSCGLASGLWVRVAGEVSPSLLSGDNKYVRLKNKKSEKKNTGRYI